MKEILIWAAFSGLLFIGFLITLILGIYKKRRNLVKISILTLIFLIGSVTYTVYLLANKTYSFASNSYKNASKSYDKMAEMFAPRTGNEIYAALFGNSASKCLKVLHYADQVVPKVDYGIWLHFETCPEELERILQLQTFTMEKLPTKGWNTEGPFADNNWFKPETLGDSVLVFSYKIDDNGNGQTIYSSLDSTKVFCLDVLD